MTDVLAGLFVIGMWVTGLAAWFTHIFNCLHDGSWAFLIAGALFFPIAIVHGVGIWFGAF